MSCCARTRKRCSIMTAAASICVAALHSLPPPLFFYKTLGSPWPPCSWYCPRACCGSRHPPLNALFTRCSLLKGAETVQELLEVAKDSIPPSHWKRTPVVLKATAGLRLLPEEKADALLFEVHCCFVCLFLQETDDGLPSFLGKRNEFY